VRADGAARISPVGPFFTNDELLFGVMRSVKAADLARDPRIVLHNAVIDGDGSEGEFKLYGRALPVTDPILRAEPADAWWHSYPEEAGLVFRVDVASAVLITWDWAASEMTTLAWSPAAGVRREVHPYP